MEKLDLEKRIELAIPPSANNTWLLRFILRLDEIHHNDRHSLCIIRTDGSFHRGTLVTISLNNCSLSDFLDIISGMPEVAKVEEDTRDRFRVTLKGTSITGQKLTTV